MNIALIGHGNMGKEIETLVREGDKHTIVYIGGGRGKTLDTDALRKADVAIDFTAPDAVMENIRAIVAVGVPLVVGTSGWYEHVDEVSALVEQHGGALIYGENLSIGGNVYFQIVAYASRLFSAFAEYDVLGYEIHHKGKKDSPSGTATRLSNIILDNFPAKKTVQEERLGRPIQPEELHFASVRGGVNRGLHTVVFDSPADEVTLTHRAHGRRGFAAGALMAAEFIHDKKGLHRFDELFTNSK